MKLMMVFLNNEYRPMVPLNLSCLESYVRKGGHEVRVFDTSFYADILNLGNIRRNVEAGSYFGVDYGPYGVRIKDESMVEDFMRAVEEFRPDLIGFGVYTYTERFADEMAKAAKKRFPDIPVLFGGVHVTTRPQWNIDKHWVDFICLGEGEAALLELCDAVEEGRTDFTGIDNVWCKRGSEVVASNLRRLIDPDTIPTPDWSSYEQYQRFGPIEGRIYNLALVEFGRGCPNRCSFCEGVLIKQINQKNKTGRWVRHRSPQKFVDDCRHLVDNYGTEFFYIVDGTFLTMRDEVLEELAHLWALKVDKPFLCLTTAQSVTPKRARLLKEMRCYQVNIGIESGNEKTRNEVYKKPLVSNDRMVQAFKHIRDQKIRTSSFNMMGLPWENRSDIFETIELNRRCKPTRTNMSIYIPFRGTQLTEYMREHGYIDSDENVVDETTSTVRLAGDLTREQLESLHRTFALYCRAPRELFPLLEACEEDNDCSRLVLGKLRDIYLPKHDEY